MAGIRPTAQMPARWMELLSVIARNGGVKRFVQVPRIYDVPFIVDRLCARGVLVRDGSNGRRWKVRITQAGASALCLGRVISDRQMEQDAKEG